MRLSRALALAVLTILASFAAISAAAPARSPSFQRKPIIGIADDFRP
ncbi:MAG TPA: hypothetical protein VEY91_08830 [Candidatus Limnocylindria bacterium]|nr:hypothetical protein [Candidatus Limnocylindria bacterium]